MQANSPTVPMTVSRAWRKMQVAARRLNLIPILEIAAVVTLFVMVVTSYLVIQRTTQASQMIPSEQAATLLIGTLVPAIALIVLIGRRIAHARAGGSTARLHVRLVFFFSLVAAIPTLLVAIFASFLFQSAIEFWFSDNSRSILDNANQLARGYSEQNLRDVGNETVAMAGDLRFFLQEESMTTPEFAEDLFQQVILRKLNESAVIEQSENGSFNVAAIVDPDDDIERARISQEQVDRIDAGESVVVIATPDRIEAVTPIDRDTGLFLYAARDSDALALSQFRRAQTVVAEYNNLTQRAQIMQLRLNLGLLLASLTLVGLAVWFALRFADRQVRPLTDLVSAARQVGAGNFAMRVDGRTGADEIGLLNRAFNRMTAQIEEQTTDLVAANEKLDERRNFIEAVVESVTAGILTLDKDRRVLLMNSSAQQLLFDTARPTAVGQELAAIAPPIDAMIEQGKSSDIIQFSRDGELLTLAVKIAPSPDGMVITFEDITRQLIDQRQAAWSDVARRIAHEIKNPLTPIQLATERLNRRYGKQIENDRELFEELTGTIIRQVGDLRKMVDEFSSFARLPKPVFRRENLVDLAKQALFLQEVSNNHINFDFQCEETEILAECDRHQIGQALTNVIKNAVEAVDARASDEREPYRGTIALSISRAKDLIRLAVTDNGVGLPEDKERIAEPYVTTREKGTGLGLAIVKKIVAEHDGDITFTSAKNGGTLVTLTIASEPSAASTEAAE